MQTPSLIVVSVPLIAFAVSTVFVLSYLTVLKFQLAQTRDRNEYISLVNVKIQEELDNLKQDVISLKSAVEFVKKSHVASSAPSSPLSPTGQLSHLVPIVSDRIGYYNKMAVVLPSLTGKEVTLEVDEFTAIECLGRLAISAELEKLELVIYPAKICSQRLYRDADQGQLYGAHTEGVVKYSAIEKVIKMIAVLLTTNQGLKHLTFTITPLASLNSMNQKVWRPLVMTSEQITNLCWAIPNNTTLETFRFYGVKMDATGSTALANAVDANKTIEEFAVTQIGNDDYMSVGVSAWEKNK